MSKLQRLWTNLETLTGPSDFETALIIFLGDYCDRGPDTRKVIDFLISLPSKYPKQSHVFLSGNHELAFGAFLGVLPSPPDGSAFSETWKEYEMNEERERGGIKVRALRICICREGSGLARLLLDLMLRVLSSRDQLMMLAPHLNLMEFHMDLLVVSFTDLMNAVPDEHKKFLADLVWVHEEDNVSIETEEGIKSCKLIAVHAGLEKDKGIQEQMESLKAKDTRISKVEALSGRKNVWEIPKELAKTPTIVLSGHHGKLHVEGLRLIIDQGGGLESNPVAAMVLPSQKIVRDTDDLTK